MKEEVIVGLVSISAGAIMLAFRDSFARSWIEAQNRVWGFHFGESDIKINKFVILVVGIGFIIFGALALIHIIVF